MRDMVSGGIALAALLAVSVAGVLSARAQGEQPLAQYPSLPARAASLAELTPPDWRIERQASGDVDGDAVADIVAVLQGGDPALVSKPFGPFGESLDANPRLVVVLLGEAHRGFRLAVTARSIVPRHDSATVEDPFGEDGGLEIAQGAFSVTLHRFATAGGTDMGNTTLTFRMMGRRCELIAFDRIRVDRFSGELRRVSIDYLTGMMRIETGTISEDVGQVVSKRVDRLPPAIEEVGDGLDFDPEQT